jgi:hypothetical protein
MSPPLNDATTALLRALAPHFAGLELIVEEIKSRSWASATFVGAHHELGLRLQGDGAEAAAGQFAARLDVRQLKLRGHILADIALLASEPTEDGIRLQLEALTVERG